MKNIALGRYVPYDTFIHRLDPRIKLFALILLTIAVFMPIGMYGFLFLITFGIIIMLISKVKIRSYFKGLKAMWIMLLLLFIFNIFLIRTGEVIDFSFLETIKLNGLSRFLSKHPIYWSAIYQSLYIFFRLGLMLAFTMILTATTKPLDITYGIEFYLSPLKVFKFPAAETAMAISIALRFIPTLMDETTRLMNAQASRGMDYQNGKLKEKISAIISLIIPLFVSCLQKSDDLAHAMIVRGYNLKVKRTRYRVFKLKLRDYCSLILVMAIFVGAITLKRFLVW